VCYSQAEEELLVQEIKAAYARQGGAVLHGKIPYSAHPIAANPATGLVGAIAALPGKLAKTLSLERFSTRVRPVGHQPSAAFTPVTTKSMGAGSASTNGSSKRPLVAADGTTLQSISSYNTVDLEAGPPSPSAAGAPPQPPPAVTTSGPSVGVLPSLPSPHVRAHSAYNSRGAGTSGEYSGGTLAPGLATAGGAAKRGPLAGSGSIHASAEHNPLVLHTTSSTGSELPGQPHQPGSAVGSPAHSKGSGGGWSTEPMRQPPTSGS
jgi:hypothetical protein